MGSRERRVSAEPTAAATRPKITLIVGHRGVGKTAALARYARYVPGARCLDLDAEIERRSGTSIPEIFRRHGEARFRAMERSTLEAVVDDARAHAAATFIAVGAGFEGDRPDGVDCIWLRRVTDGDGRIFLDRPRLDATVDPLDEFTARIPSRDATYARLADRALELREGGVDPNESEAQWLDGTLRLDGAIATLLADPNADRFARTITRWLGFGLAIEVRDDLLDDAQREYAIDAIPADRLLASCRRPRAHAWAGAIRSPSRLDWDVSLGDAPHAGAIRSLHATVDRGGVPDAARRLEAAGPPGATLKLAVRIAHFADLVDGHRWMCEAPDTRTFLPISDDGRWAWYRILRRGHAGLSFVREHQGSAPDQPTFLDWAAAVDRPTAFAAVLGDPIAHSRTPVRHHAFFAARGMPTVAVRIGAGEWDAALDALTALGLTHAAVTSPHKRAAHDACAERSAVAERLGAVNTLHRQAGAWCGHNTDLEGLRTALAAAGIEASADDVVVWGGGALRATLEAALPRATFHAARTGERRRGRDVAPRALVVATSRLVAPLPTAWRPALIFDLDYRENCAGRRLAQRYGVPYVSGSAMFEAQADAQQAYWRVASGAPIE